MDGSEGKEEGQESQGVGKYNKFRDEKRNDERKRR